MRNLGFIISTMLLSVVFSSCSNAEPKVTRTDTVKSGVAQIVVDECLAPVIQQQVDVFEALHPDATIIPIYTSELDAYRLFMSDSIRLIIGARKLTSNEEKIIEERKQRLRSQKLAVDGVALIVNENNKDTLLTKSDLIKIFTGEIQSWNELNPTSKLGPIKVTFDRPNSSTARYIKDSICVDKEFGANIAALSLDSASMIDLREGKTPNQKVIDYIASTPNAIGVIGVNWISSPTDSTNLTFINKVKVVAISSEEIATKQNSYLPFPYQMALKKYPLTRDIYIIISDVMGGLPSGFVHFSAGNEGQRIITKSGLLPATRPTRMVRVRPTL